MRWIWQGHQWRTVRPRLGSVFRAVDAIWPGLVFLENSPEIRTKGRRDIIRALVERGYSWRDGTVAAAAAWLLLSE